MLVHVIQLDHRMMDLDGIWYGRYAIWVYPRIVFPISYNLKYQLGWRTNFWGKIDTALLTAGPRWCQIIGFRKIHNFHTVILVLCKITTLRLKQTKIGYQDSMPCLQVQYRTTDLTSIVVYWYWFSLLEESIKNTWFVQLQTEVVWVR